MEKRGTVPPGRQDRAENSVSKSKVQVSTKAMLSCFWVILLGPLPEVQCTFRSQFTGQFSQTRKATSQPELDNTFKNLFPGDPVLCQVDRLNQLAQH